MKAMMKPLTKSSIDFPLCCGMVDGCYFDADGAQVEVARFLGALSLRVLAFVVLLGSGKFVDFVKCVDWVGVFVDIHLILVSKIGHRLLGSGVGDNEVPVDCLGFGDRCCECEHHLAVRLAARRNPNFCTFWKFKDGRNPLAICPMISENSAVESAFFAGHPYFLSLAAAVYQPSCFLLLNH